MKFRQKVEEAEAWRFLPGDDDRPLWVLNALVRGILYWSGGEPGYFTLSLLTGSYRVRPGDWIVCWPGERLEVVKAEEFAERFEAVS